MMSRLGVWFMGVLARPSAFAGAARHGAALGRCCLCWWCHGASVALRNLEAVLSAGIGWSSARSGRESFIVFARPGWIAAGCGPPLSRWWRARQLRRCA